MSIDRLNRLWNQLRNRALGRGTTPQVSPELADRVSKRFAAWRRVRNRQLTRPQLNAWVDRYNGLRAAVDAERGTSTPTAPKATSILPESASVTSSLAGGAAGVALLAAAVLYAMSRR